MNMNFRRKLPIPQEIKAQYPLTEQLAAVKAARDAEISDVDTILATNRGIHRTEECRGDKTELHTSHICRCDKTCNVGDDTSSYSEDEGLTVGTHLDEATVDLLDGGEALGLLSLTYEYRLVGCYKGAVCTVDVPICDDDNAPLGQQLGE